MNRNTELKIVDPDDDSVYSLKICMKNENLYLNNKQVRIKTPTEMSEDELDTYEDLRDTNERLARISASLFFFPFEDPIDGSGTMTALVDELAYRVSDTSKLLNTCYIVSDHFKLKCPETGKEIDLPSTGSDLAYTNMSQLLNELSN